MTDMTIERDAEFRIGNVLTRAWQILGPNFLLFFCVTFVVALPNLIFLLRDPTTPNLTLIFLSIFLTMVVNALGQAIILFQAFQYLRGRPVRIDAALQRALARFLPVVGAGLLYGLGIMFGLFLLVVPGLFLMTMWAVTVPVCVVEGLGPVASLTRSSQLTKGYRWKVFGILILLTIVSIVLNQLVTRLAAPLGIGVTALLTLIVTAAWATYWNSALIMIYHDLRVAKEGADTEQIASVFD